MKPGTATTKTMRARDIPRSWHVELPDDPDATVTVSISLVEKPSRRRLVDFIGTGQGVYPTRADADAAIGTLRDEWRE